MRWNIPLLFCVCALGCRSYVVSDPPAQPVSAEHVHAAAEQMCRSILALDEISSAYSAVNIRFDGIENKTRFFTPVNLFGEILMSRLSRANSSSVRFSGSAAKNEDVDYVLKGSATSASSATTSGISDYIVITMILEDPISKEGLWRDSYEMKVTTRKGTVYQ